MILGFAHVSIGCEWGTEFLTSYGVPSSRKKWPFLVNRPATHDLVVDFPGLVPIELVMYDTGLIKSPTRIRIRERNCIEIRARDDEAEMRFLAPLGIWVNRIIRIGSHIKRWRSDIWVHKDEQAPVDPPLDVYGCSSIAFYSTDPDGDAQKLIAAGGRDYTGVFKMFLNGKLLNIAMLRSPEGTPIELVKIVKE